MPETPMPETICIFAPHPDDEVLGCGGISARKAREGARILVYLLTDGSHLGTHLGVEDPPPAAVSAQRKEESRRAADILGVGREHHRYLDYVDGTLADHHGDAVSRVAAVLQELQPDAIYYMNANEGHRDHVASHAIVREACERVGYAGRRFQYFVGPREEPGEEALRVDISAVLDLKRRACEENRSHLETLGPGQAEPSWPVIPERFLRAEECFLVD